MFETTRLIHIPSLGKFVKFKELQNQHFMALVKSQDSLADSVCTQYDILCDRLDDDSVSVNSLTLIDSLFIFLNWRINCISNHIPAGDGGGHIEATDWLMRLHQLIDKNFYKEIYLEDSDMTVVVDLPTIADDMETQKFFLKLGSDAEDRILESTHLNAVCVMTSIIKDGERMPFESVKEKIGVFDVLTPNDHKKIIDYSLGITKILNKVSLDLKVESDVVIRIDLISSLIRFLFCGNVENILNESLFLSKKGNMSYTDFMNMTPIDSGAILEYLQPKDGNKSDDITDEYIKNF